MFKINRLDFLISLYIACICIAELMGAKTFPITKIGTFQLSASVAIFVIPLIYSINDIISEVLGKERARSVVRSGLIIIAILLVFSLLATNLPSTSRFEKVNPAYVQIFSFSARIAGASLTAFTIAEFADVYIFAKIREKLGKSRLWLRNNASNILSALLDTVIFMFLAFYSFDRTPADNIVFLTGLILPYWLLKCFMSIIETPFVYLGVNWLRAGVDSLHPPGGGRKKGAML